MYNMKELPERLNHERGHVIYEPEMGNMEFGIAKATDESNWPVTAEMVRRYNAYALLVETLRQARDDLAQINNYAEECGVVDGPINQIIDISDDGGEKVRIALEKELT